MKKSDVKDYASTKHKGKPEKVKQETRVKNLIKSMVREVMTELHEDFGGALKKEDREKFDKMRQKQSEVLGYTLTGKSDIRSEIGDATIKEAKKRDYKAEYKKYGSSKKAKKYRAELNAYNRKKGTYGNGDGKDASHKGGKIVGFEKESVNRGRAEKSRLKKEMKEGGPGSGPQIDLDKYNKDDIGHNGHWKKKKKKDGKISEKFTIRPPAFSSKEAKNVVDGALRDYSKDLKKLQYRVIKDWMSKAKSGVIDYFDLVRGFKMGDAKRANPYEVEFLMSVLTKDKIIDRFRKYFGGRKGKKR